MRSYAQYCPVARGLDLIGDRWTLLIVRELLTRGPCRHTDIKAGLPGVASNLLVDRLRVMEQDGLIRREQAPPPVATTLFHLTDRGRALSPVLGHIALWAEPGLGSPRAGEEFRAHWLALPARQYLTDHQPDAPPAIVHLGVADDYLAVQVGKGVKIRPARPDDDPSATATGAPDLLVGLITGRLSLTAARRHGLRVTGSAEKLERVLPSHHTGGSADHGKVTTARSPATSSRAG